MVKCKYFMPGDRAVTHMDFTGAREGYFLQLGQAAGETYAFIRDRNGKINRTLPEYVVIEESSMDRLRDKVLTEVQKRVSPTRYHALEADIIRLFEIYGD